MDNAHLNTKHDKDELLTVDLFLLDNFLENIKNHFSQNAIDDKSGIRKVWNILDDTVRLQKQQDIVLSQYHKLHCTINSFHTAVYWGTGFSLEYNGTDHSAIKV